MGDLSTSEINVILDTAERLGKRPSEVLRGRQVALLFYETSTRTRNSFLTAVHQLGATVCGFDSLEATSVSKGETLQDTIRMFEAYADALEAAGRTEEAALLREQLGMPRGGNGGGHARHGGGAGAGVGQGQGKGGHHGKGQGTGDGCAR